MITPIKEGRRVVGHTLTCDQCSESFELEEDDFDKVRDQMKKDGWMTTRVNGFWKNRCPDCKREFNGRFYND